MEVLLYTVLTLCVLGILAALILYFVAQKFKVEEDPRIDEVEKMLPGANCGGCGFAGCRGLSDALVKRTDISFALLPGGRGRSDEDRRCLPGQGCSGEGAPGGYRPLRQAVARNVPGSMRTTVLRPARWLLRFMAEKRGVRTAAWDTGIV